MIMQSEFQELNGLQLHNGYRLLTYVQEAARKRTLESVGQVLVFGLGDLFAPRLCHVLHIGTKDRHGRLPE